MVYALMKTPGDRLSEAIGTGEFTHACWPPGGPAR
jgi:hypothetical protein